MFDLETFLPYRLSILSQTISGLVAREYESKFGLSMNQWRCLVIIHAHQPVTAKEIAPLTLLDKMAISRAIKILEKRKLIKTSKGKDARSRMLNLTHVGNKIYEEVIPIAQKYETSLLSSLTDKQQSALKAIINQLLQEARELSVK
ncbi:MAG: MarR family transcriptional regulator [Robiginitomaculum sp.]|nr:MarR family transcriptional regulator [Robiginitomaculum sp.]